jgi:hypothetical protein
MGPPWRLAECRRLFADLEVNTRKLISLHGGAGAVLVNDPSWREADIRRERSPQEGRSHQTGAGSLSQTLDVEDICHARTPSSSQRW